jgi:SAM-dependent methyltransferase
MELSSEIFNKLIHLIDDAKKNKNYEFEVRFWNKNNNVINEENYKKIFQKFTFSKDNNGLEFNYIMKNILDVLIDKNITDDSGVIRMSINGEDNVKKYWINSENNEIEKIFIEKEKLDKVDDNNYNLRFSLNNELPQNDLLNKNKKLLESNSYEKTYRFKNRYSIKTDDNLFLIDMSAIKMGHGKSFKESTTLKEPLKYEIEIEFIGKESELDSSIICKKLLYYIEIILKILQNTTILLTNTIINKLKLNYNNLIKNKNNDIFIAASPVTIHRENLIKSDTIKNIYNKYAVTLKADGDRNFLIVHSSKNKNENGKIYIFNNNFNFIDTGYKDDEWVDTLIEGEFIDNNGDNASNNSKELYMYDILFSKGYDVRKKYLIDINKESKYETRLQILDQFAKSASRVLSEPFTEQNSIKIKNKKYLQSFRNDGSDIFQKVKELWETRKYSTFNVDGIIFVPKYEYYPYRGGTWKNLFKWKPPELNTIDFLIRVLKDDNKKDIKNPYISVITRVDGKQETILKQYKVVKLFVSGEKTVFNINSSNKNKRAEKKRIPVPFNPFGLDEKNSENYNLVKIFIEDDEKIYAYDPLTNEKVEIYDDIIVEFGYDNSREDGFKWIPYRFRKDKTGLYKSGKPVYGNAESVAIDIFRAINLPVTEEMITTGNVPISQDSVGVNQTPYYIRSADENGKRERFPYQNFHNHYVKYQLLYFTSPSYINDKQSGFHGKILDLCCGKGVDFNKIKKARYAELVGMDIDYQNIKDAQEWFKSMVTPPPKAYYVRGDSSKLIMPEQACGETETEKLYTKKFIPTKYLFDTVSLQFCFHYFFKDEISFRTILQNINDNLKIGGFVIGTTFDGERIYEALKDSDSISGKTFSGETMWKIDKKYGSRKISFGEKNANFGKEIEVFVKTIGVPHPEYLVNFNYVDKLMQEYGFSKVVLKPFEEFYQELIEGKNLMDLSNKELEKDISVVKEMSEEEKRFSFFSSGFIYKKEKNSSDSLMKKLVEMMEKKHKLKKHAGKVVKVDANTEHIIQDVEVI